MTKTTNVNPKGMGIDDLKPHVRRGLENLRKGEYVASYGLKDSEELIKSSEETDALPERGDKDHPFSKFLVAVATEISQELGIAKGKKKKFVKDMEDKLFTTSKDWVGLIREKSQPESNSTAASITDDAEEANVSKEKDEAGGKKDETKSSKNDKAGGKKNETKSSKNDKAGAKKGETKSSKKDEAGAKKNQTKSSKMEAKKKPTTTPKKPNSKSLSDDTNEREKDQTEAKKVQKKRGKQEDDVIETASSKKLKTKATPADKKDNGEDDSEVLLQSKVEFEAERDATLERLPSDVKDLFGQVCLAKWGKETLPALVLNPYSVAPGPVRDEWLEHFKVFKTGHEMANLVYWYGSYTKPQEAYSFLLSDKIVQIEEETSADDTADKIIELCTWNNDQETRERVYSEMVEDLNKSPDKRRGQMGPFDEVYVATQHEEEEEDSDDSDEDWGP